MTAVGTVRSDARTRATPAQPFTAPAVMPAMIWRAAKKMKTRGGSHLPASEPPIPSRTLRIPSTRRDRSSVLSAPGTEDLGRVTRTSGRSRRQLRPEPVGIIRHQPDNSDHPHGRPVETTRRAVKIVPWTKSPAASWRSTSSQTGGGNCGRCSASRRWKAGFPATRSGGTGGSEGGASFTDRSATELRA